MNLDLNFPSINHVWMQFLVFDFDVVCDLYCSIQMGEKDEDAGDATAESKAEEGKEEKSADVDEDGMWEETFNGHEDTKPRGICRHLFMISKLDCKTPAAKLCFPDDKFW